MDELKELAEAAYAYRHMKGAIYDGAGHYESDEISCSCGFISNAADYDMAQKSLHNHIRRHRKKSMDARLAIVERLDALLAKHLPQDLPKDDVSAIL